LVSRENVVARKYLCTFKKDFNTFLGEAHDGQRPTFSLLVITSKGIYLGLSLWWVPALPGFWGLKKIV
jgi:hypothetical protein